MPTTGLDLCKTAAKKLNILAAGESLSGDDATDILAELNRIINDWNAEQAMIFAAEWANHVCTANLSPHTIGPTGTFVVTQRPVTIDGASLVLTASDPDVYVPINTTRTKAWWDAQAIPGLTSGVPTDLYYDPTWTNGSLFFWPVPNAALTVRLQTRTRLETYLLVTDFSLPPGYESALTLTLAEGIASMFQVPVPPSVEKAAAKARARIQANNWKPTTLRTQDAGMPRSGRGAWTNSKFRTGGLR